MKTITVYNDKREKQFQIPSNATHYMFGSAYGVYYKVGSIWYHQGDNGHSQVIYDLDTDKYASYYNKTIHEVQDFTHDKPINNVDYVKEAKDRINGAFGGSFPIGQQFISSGFIDKEALMNGSGLRIGDGGGCESDDGFASRHVLAKTKTDLDLIAEFAPDFTKHEDCDIAVIRDIVEQYRNKIKQLQESKK